MVIKTPKAKIGSGAALCLALLTILSATACSDDGGATTDGPLVADAQSYKDSTVVADGGQLPIDDAAHRADGGAAVDLPDDNTDGSGQPDQGVVVDRGGTAKDGGPDSAASYDLGVGSYAVMENYDAQNEGERCGNFWNDAKDSTVTSAEAYSGSKSCRFAIAKGSFGWGGGFVLPKVLRKGDEGWVRFRLYLPAGFDYNAYSAGNHLKFVRWTTKNSSGGNAGYMDWYWDREGTVPPFRAIREFDSCTNDCWQYFGSANDKPQRGVWETYEMYVKFDDRSVDQGGTGRVRAWKNGMLLGDLTARPTLPAATDTVMSVRIFSYWNGGAPKDQHLYFDDLVATLTTPQAKDVQGNAFIGP